MATPITFDLDATNKGMYEKILQLERQVSKLQGELGNTGARGAKAFGEIQQSAVGLFASIVGANGITGAIQSLIGAVKNAYAEMQEQHRKFLQNIGTTSDAKARFLYNAVNLPGGKAAAERLAQDVASASGAKLPQVYDILATGISAGGTGETLRSAAVTAAQLEQRGIGKGSELVGSALDLANITGQSNAQANFAFLRQIGASARVVSLEAQQNLLPGLTAGKLAGDSAERTGELAAAMNMAMKDTEGNKTATAMIELITTLKRDAIVPTTVVDPATGKKKTKFTKVAGETTSERIANLQEMLPGMSRDEQDTLFAKIGGRAAMKPVVEMMLRNTPEWKQIMGTMEQKIQAPGSAGAMEQFGQFMTDTGTGAEAVTQASRRAAAAVEKGGTLGRERQALKAAAAESGKEWIAQQGMGGILENKAAASMDVISQILTLGLTNLLPGGVGKDVETYRRRVEAQTSDKAKGTEAYQEMMASLTAMQQARDVAVLKEAGLGDLASTLEKLNVTLDNMADRAAGPVTPKKQEVD
jgi:hypothetical protein